MPYTRLIAVAVVTAVTPAIAQPVGTVRGAVIFEGTPPARTPQRRATDPACGEALSDDVIVTNGKLKDVLVRIKNGSLPARRLPRRSAAPASTTTAPAAPAAAPPASTAAAPASVSPAPASVSPAPASASPAPASMSPAPASASPAPASVSPAPASVSPAPAAASPAAPAASLPPPAVIDQRGCAYTPRVIGLVAGQQLQVRNSDGTFHNVHGTVAGTLVWNKPAPQGGDPIIVDGSPRAGDVIEVTCDVHPWMRAYAVVQDHAAFAVTGADGSFELRNVPPGKYTIEAWHPVLGTRTVEIQLGVGARAGVTTKLIYRP